MSGRRPPSRTVRLIRADVQAVIDLAAPLLHGGVCLACRAETRETSPPYVQHNTGCWAMARYQQIRSLLEP
jgi:hypothetical protein